MQAHHTFGCEITSSLNNKKHLPTSTAKKPNPQQQKTYKHAQQISSSFVFGMKSYMHHTAKTKVEEEIKGQHQRGLKVGYITGDGL